MAVIYNVEPSPPNAQLAAVFSVRIRPSKHLRRNDVDAAGLLATRAVPSPLIHQGSLGLRGPMRGSAKTRQAERSMSLTGNANQNGLFRIGLDT